MSFKKELTLLHYRRNTIQFKIVAQCNRMLISDAKIKPRWRRMIESLANIELKRMLKEAVVAEFEVLT
jgi:hypothetical protein